MRGERRLLLSTLCDLELYRTVRHLLWAGLAVYVRVYFRQLRARAYNKRQLLLLKFFAHAAGAAGWPF